MKQKNYTSQNWSRCFRNTWKDESLAKLNLLSVSVWNATLATVLCGEILSTFVIDEISLGSLSLVHSEQKRSNLGLCLSCWRILWSTWHQMLSTCSSVFAEKYTQLWTLSSRLWARWVCFNLAGLTRSTSNWIKNWISLNTDGTKLRERQKEKRALRRPSCDCLVTKLMSGSTHIQFLGVLLPKSDMVGIVIWCFFSLRRARSWSRLLWQDCSSAWLKALWPRAGGLGREQEPNCSGTLVATGLSISWVGFILLFFGISLVWVECWRDGKAESLDKSRRWGVILRIFLVSWQLPLFLKLGLGLDNVKLFTVGNTFSLLGDDIVWSSYGWILCSFTILINTFQSLEFKIT